MAKESFGSLFSKHVLDSWIKQEMPSKIFHSISRTQWAAIILSLLMIGLLFQRNESQKSAYGFMRLNEEIELKNGCRGMDKSKGKLIYMGVESCVALKEVEINCQDLSIILGDEDLKKIGRLKKRKNKRFIFTNDATSELSECDKIKKIIYETY